MKKKNANSRRTEEMNLLIEQLKKTPIVQIACEKIGIGRATYYRWRKEKPGFAKQADEAILDGKKLINDMAESQLLGAIRDRNLTAIIFWLKNHHGDYKNRLELSGEVTTKNEPLTLEQQKIIREALQLVSTNYQNPLHPNQLHKYE